MDVLALKAGKPRAVISCKWSIRHDRISDPTNECTSAGPRVVVALDH
jgi:hypothetical protein